MKLFSPYKLGSIELKNRVVMAPMTRSRASNNVPNDLMAKYYSDRASAGLLITEGVSPSPHGLGYARIPGCFNEEQATGWKKVATAVHQKGGHIFMQLMHTGRVSHPANMPPNTRVLSSSTKAVSGMMWTDTQGQQPHPAPQEMSENDIRDAVEEYAKAAEYAVKAGFDGVELHAANGYLLEQFLNPNINTRTDRYGGSSENRMRFPLEVAKAVADRIGAARTAIRISPYGVFNDTGAFTDVDAFYGAFASKLSALGLIYIHVVDHSAMGAPPVSAEVKRLVRENFKGAYILSGGYDAARAEHDLAENKGELVAFGRPFIANPDLVTKLRDGKPLKEADQSKFYTPGAEGYTDY